mmetsp:Transcript_23874/g.26486  ORF Transcript_23874/g.26486 Transcript_23874/m.26486 type:complete len:343 (+) Transcript_23874:519-1547(+)
MGARAIICARDTQRSYIGEEMYANDGSDHSSITIPIVSVSLDDFDEFFLKPANGSIVIVRIITEPNNFMEVYGSVWMWVWQISLACYFVFNAGFSCFRLFQLYQLYGDCRLSVGVAAVTSCLIASIILFLGFSIDPFGSRQIFPVWLIRFLFIQHLPFVIAPMFLMALWWHAILASLKFQIQGSLPKYKWYAFAWIAFLIVFNITFALLNAFEKVKVSRVFFFWLVAADILIDSGISLYTSYCFTQFHIIHKYINILYCDIIPTKEKSKQRAPTWKRKTDAASKNHIQLVCSHFIYSCCDRSLCTSCDWYYKHPKRCCTVLFLFLAWFKCIDYYRTYSTTTS